LNGEYSRDEAGQAAYLRKLLEAFEAGDIDSAFVFTFALYDHPHRPDMPWEPKAAFTTLADYYRG
jgi:hypothetical protein